MKPNQPLTADYDKMRKLGENLWYFKGKFLIKTYNKNSNFPTYFIYNKYEEGKGKDLCWFSQSLQSVRDMFMILEEEVPVELCTDLKP